MKKMNGFDDLEKIGELDKEIMFIDIKSGMPTHWTTPMLKYPNVGFLKHDKR